MSTGSNEYIMLCSNNYMNIGAQGKGPAIHLDATFKNCSTNESKTFYNKMLNGRQAGALIVDGRFAESFEVQDMEAYIV